MRQKPKIQFYRNNIFKIILLLSITTQLTKAQTTSNLECINFIAIKKTLDGIRVFETPNLQGVLGTSIAGGCDIQIVGDPFNLDINNLQFVFNNSQHGLAKTGDAITEYNEYNSNPEEGRIQYTTPDAKSLTGLSLEDFKDLKSLSLSLNILDLSQNQGTDASSSKDGNLETIKQYQCNLASNCLIKYSLDYTPILYYMTPRVAFDDSEVALIIDPKSAQTLKTSMELFFKHAFIDSNMIDFNEFVQTYTILSANTKNQVRGKVKQAMPNSSSDLRFKFKAGYAINDQVTSLQCSYNNDSCYEAKIVPSITQITLSQGILAGNQLLEINGFGFSTFIDSDLKKILNVSIDGVPCLVTKSTNTNIKCLTGSKSAPSNESYYVGSNGVKRDFFTSETPLTWTLLNEASPIKSSLITTLELSQNQLKSYSGNKLSGYFKPPADGKYRFYMSCDDACQLYLSNVTMDQTKKNLILSIGGATPYRGYFNPTNSRVSAWQSLNADEYYYYEVHHIQHLGNDHLTVSVEIENNYFPGHHQSSKEIQRLQINPQNIREQFKIVVNNPDGQNYTLKLFKGSVGYTYNINMNATSQQLQQAIQPFFSTYCCAYSVPLSVNRTMYDLNGNVVTNQDLSVKNQYLITVNRAIAQPSFAFGGALNQSTGQPISASRITLMKPSDVQLSSPPLSGSFRITCLMTNGQVNQTEDLLYNASISKIKSSIVQTCTQYLDKIDISDGNLYNYYQDGRDIIIRFTGVNYDPDQFIIESSFLSPLQGGTSSVDIQSLTQEPYGQNLMWEPVPFEWLYTAENKPQVQCQIDGIPCICSSLKCSFEYIDAPLSTPPSGGRRLQSYSSTSILDKMKQAPKRLLQFEPTPGPWIDGLTVNPPSNTLNFWGGQILTITKPTMNYPDPNTSKVKS